MEKGKREGTKDGVTTTTTTVTTTTTMTMTATVKASHRVCASWRHRRWVGWSLGRLGILIFHAVTCERAAARTRIYTLTQRYVLPTSGTPRRGCESARGIPQSLSPTSPSSVALRVRRAPLKPRFSGSPWPRARRKTGTCSFVPFSGLLLRSRENLPVHRRSRCLRDVVIPTPFRLSCPVWVVSGGAGGSPERREVRVFRQETHRVRPRYRSLRFFSQEDQSVWSHAGGVLQAVAHPVRHQRKATLPEASRRAGTGGDQR